MNKLYIEWTMADSVDLTDDPSDFVDQINGVAYTVELDEEYERVGDPVKVGIIVLQRLRMEAAISMGETPYDVMDAHSASLAMLFPSWAALVEGDLAFDLDLSQEIVAWDALVVDSLTILPEYRGNKLGLEVLARAIAQHAPFGTPVMLSPQPYGEDNPDKDEEGITALVDYYSKLGFKTHRYETERTQVMVFDGNVFGHFTQWLGYVSA